MSDAPAVPKGSARTLSRAAAIFLFPAALTSMRLGGPLWGAMALVAALAFESNRHRVPSVVRLLAILAQLGALVSFLAMGMSVAFMAESGRDALFLRGVTVLIVLGLALPGVWAFVAAVRTLK